MGVNLEDLIVVFLPESVSDHFVKMIGTWAKLFLFRSYVFRVHAVPSGSKTAFRPSGLPGGSCDQVAESVYLGPGQRVWQSTCHPKKTVVFEVVQKSPQN